MRGLLIGVAGVLAGALLVLMGFGLQSLQYWVVLLNIPVR